MSHTQSSIFTYPIHIEIIKEYLRGCKIWDMEVHADVISDHIMDTAIIMEMDLF